MHFPADFLHVFHKILWKKQIISVKNVNQLVSIRETQSVSCAVGTESLNNIQKRPSLHRLSWFSSVFKQMLRWLPNPRCYCALLMQPSPPKFIKIKPHCNRNRWNYFSKLHNFTLIKKILISRPLSQATPSNHSNVFMFNLLLSQEREGEAWEPSTKTIPFLPSSQ
jgi:hypothetical protein